MKGNDINSSQFSLPSNTAEPVEKGEVEVVFEGGMTSQFSLPSNTTDPVENGEVEVNHEDNNPMKSPGSKPGSSTSHAWKGPGAEPGIGNKKTIKQKI